MLAGNKELDQMGVFIRSHNLITCGHLNLANSQQMERVIFFFLLFIYDLCVSCFRMLTGSE